MLDAYRAENHFFNQLACRVFAVTETGEHSPLSRKLAGAYIWEEQHLIVQRTSEQEKEDEGHHKGSCKYAQAYFPELLLRACQTYSVFHRLLFFKIGNELMDAIINAPGQLVQVLRLRQSDGFFTIGHKTQFYEY